MRRERHNFFLCWLFHLNPSTCGTPAVAHKVIWPQLISTTAFFSNPQNPQPFRAWRHSCPWYISYLGFLLWHLWLSHPPQTHVLTNPCTKGKVLSLTKPKGKIYKMKNDNIKKNPSAICRNTIGHYIRIIWMERNKYNNLKLESFLFHRAQQLLNFKKTKHN